MSVRRGADCNTDQRMLRAKVVLGGRSCLVGGMLQELLCGGGVS